MRGATVEVKCERCKSPFTARVADRKRGWGKFCSKSCKAVRQTQLGGGNGHGYYAREFGGVPQFDRRGNYEGFQMSAADLACGGYGDSDWDAPFGEGKA